MFLSISSIRLREFSASAEARNTAALMVLSAPPTLSAPDAASSAPWADTVTLMRGSRSDMGPLHAGCRAVAQSVRI